MQLSSTLFLIGTMAIVFSVFAGCTAKKADPIGSLPISSLKIHDKEYRVEVARTSAEQQQGLSDRDQLGSDGMLFVFVPARKPGFWMIDMKFDLDFIWIKDGMVTEIMSDVKKPAPGQTSSQLPNYYPQENADMMLEVNAGFAEKAKIKIGDKIELH